MIYKSGKPTAVILNVGRGPVIDEAAMVEALRTRRPHRPAFSHSRAVKLMTTESIGQFDPTILNAFNVAAPWFETIFQDGEK